MLQCHCFVWPNPIGLLLGDHSASSDEVMRTVAISLIDTTLKTLAHSRLLYQAEDLMKDLVTKTVF